jgi:TPR repeat protein
MNAKLIPALLLGLAFPAQAQVSMSEAGIQSSIEVDDPYLRQMRKDMVAVGRIPFDALRALADLGDGLAAFKMGEYLASTGKPALQDDALHYFSIAAYTGRDFAVPHLLRVLSGDQSETSATRLKGAEDALRLWARRGDAKAVAGLAEMYLAGEPFGAKTEEGLALLEQSAQTNGKAAVELGMLYLKGRPDLPADAEKARAVLTLALDSDDLASQAMAQNLLRSLPPAATTAATTVSTAGVSE